MNFKIIMPERAGFVYYRDFDESIPDPGWTFANLQMLARTEYLEGF